MAISETEMAGLSDEERQALEGEHDEPTTATEEHDEGVDEGDTSVAAAPVDGEKKEAPAAAEATPLTEEGSAATPPDFTPRYEVPTVEDFDAKLSTLEAQEVELRKKLAEGDVTIDEYDAEKSRLGKEIRQLERAQHEAEMYSKMNQQLSAQKWAWEQEQFFSADANALYKDKLLLAALDVAVKDLANDPQHSAKTGAWFLREADRQVRERFQLADRSATGEPVKGAPRKPDLSAVPKTLASIPTAELPDTGGDEFAGLDKLSGIELEKRLARMSPEEVDRYLRAAA